MSTELGVDLLQCPAAVASRFLVVAFDVVCTRNPKIPTRNLRIKINEKIQQFPLRSYVVNVWTDAANTGLQSAGKITVAD